MVVTSIVRRSSSTIFPVAFRSRIAFQGVLNVETRRRSDEIGRKCLQFFRFSTAVSENLIADHDDTIVRLLKSEILMLEQLRQAEIIRDDFPFEIEDNLGWGSIFLKRKYRDEMIKVEVYSRSSTQNVEEPRLEIEVSIFKGDGPSLRFRVTASRDEIAIKSWSMRKSDDRFMPYEVPDFERLDHNLQQEFYKYLEIRGIKAGSGFTNFLFKYIGGKDCNYMEKELPWMKSLKNFFDKDGVL